MEFLNTIINHRLWHKHAERGALGLAILCSIAIAASSGWTVYSKNKIKQQNYQPQDLVLPSDSEGATYRVRDIVAANLFGNPRPTVQVRKAPKTTLNLTLQGVLSATDSALARAIIQSGKKRSNLYSVGEEIKGAGASVKEIHEHEVLLDRNGALESLPLIKKAKSGDRQIITYSRPKKKTTPNVAAAVSDAAITQDMISSNVSNVRSANGEPRKIRKPNLSGLDRALKKRGEL